MDFVGSAACKNAYSVNLAPQYKHLRWRCRRGMKELDQVLNQYLDAHSDSWDDTNARAFEELLSTEDDQLWAWLLGQDTPTRSDWKLIIETMRLTSDRQWLS